jgi:hypothetical protein
MNIKTRLAKIESRLLINDSQINWDFSKTTTEQLTKLVELPESEYQTYSKQLIDAGFIKYTVKGKSK